MRKSRFSEQQIAFILKQADDGTVEEVCRKAGISIQTYYHGAANMAAWCFGDEAAEGARGGERSAEAAGHQPQPRQGDAAGRHPPKNVAITYLTNLAPRRSPNRQRENGCVDGEPEP
jgi:hypothetical protein